MKEYNVLRYVNFDKHTQKDIWTVRMTCQGKAEAEARKKDLEKRNPGHIYKIEKKD